MNWLRKMFSKRSSKYTFITWVSFFGTILLTTIVISVVLYQNFERINLNAISSINKELSIQADNISSYIQGVIKISGMQTFYNPSVSKLRVGKNIKNFDMIMGIRELNSFASSNPSIHSVYVYNGQQDYIYATADNVSDSTDRFADQEAVKLLKNCKPEDRLVPTFRTIYGTNLSEGQDVYTFIMYELKTDGRSFDNALIINVYSDWINNILFQSNSYLDALIVDKDGHIVASTENVEKSISEFDGLNIRKILDSGDENGYIIAHSSFEKMVYLYAKLTCNDWYYIRIMPYSECMKDLSALKTKTFSIVIFVFIAGLGISLIMLMRIYIPFRKIILSLSKAIKGNNQDVDFILENIDYLVEDAMNTSKTKESYAALLKEEFLKQLLKGPVPQMENIARNFKQYNINLSLDEPFTLLIIQGDKLKDYIDVLKSIAPKAAVEGVLMSGYSILLLQFIDSQDIERICSHIQGAAHAGLVAYSKPIYGYSNLKKSYIRMCEVAAFHIFYPDQAVLSEKMLDQKLKDNVYPDKMESELISELKCGNLEQAKKQFNLILKEMLNYRYNTILFTFKRLYLTVMSLYKDICGFENEETLPATLEALEDKFHSIQNFQEITVIFFDFFERICQQIEYNRQSKNAKLVEYVKRRIAESYSDPNLSPQQLSDEIGMSCPYLVKLFKSSEGVSISSYIKEVRIEKAKDLLRASNFSIKDIADQVGFANSQYFFTLFKNSTNKTPKEYRLIVRQSRNN